MSLDTMKEIALAAENDQMRTQIQELVRALRDNSQLLLRLELTANDVPEVRKRILANSLTLFHVTQRGDSEIPV